MRNEVITLVTVTKSEQDADGFRHEESKTLQVMAQMKSASRSEFYEAARDDIKVAAMAVIDHRDYMAAAEMVEDADGVERRVLPSKVIDEGNVEYKIVRAWRGGKNYMELTLEEVGHGGI